MDFLVISGMILFPNDFSISVLQLFCMDYRKQWGIYLAWGYRVGLWMEKKTQLLIG